MKKSKEKVMNQEINNPQADNMSTAKPENAEKVAEENVESQVNENIENKNGEELPAPENTVETENIKEVKQQYEKEIMEWKDKYLRLSAEFDNYRKRTLKEKMELSKSANEEVLKGILPVIDDFERGLKILEETEDINAVKEGIILIYNKFKEFLTQQGIKEISIEEKDFNTDFHEAITKIPVEDESLKGKIVEVIQKGYLLNDKVIRYAKVIIGE
jgi:molecular chaperone GrpE